MVEAKLDVVTMDALSSAVVWEFIVDGGGLVWEEC